MASQEKRSQDGAAVGSPAVKTPVVGRFYRHLRTRVASGFLILVPILITYLILVFIVGPLDRLLRPLFDGTRLDFPGIGVIVTVLTFYLVGAFLAGQRFQKVQDAVLSRIPMVNVIYGVAKQATEALSGPVGHHYSRVVLVQWPRADVHALGFVTGHLGGPSGDSGEQMVAVYIPTVPNPTSGMLAFFAEEDIVETNITVEDAMKTVFSGGIVLPEAPGYQTMESLPSVEEPVDTK